MKPSFFAVIASVSIVAGCAKSTVTPVAKNQFILSTSAAPVCGSTGAQKVASKMAAVETLRRGYDRYIIAGAQNANNVSVINRAPTGATTTGTFNTFGNTTYGSANTTYYGGGPMVMGSHDAQLAVVMFRRGERGYENALDAKQLLGADWEELVKSGAKTCG